MTPKPSKEAMELLLCPFCGAAADSPWACFWDGVVRTQCTDTTYTCPIKYIMMTPTEWNTRAHASKYEKIAREGNEALREAKLETWVATNPQGGCDIRISCSCLHIDLEIFWVKGEKETHSPDCPARPWAELIGGGE